MLVRTFETKDIQVILSWFPTPEALAQWGSPARIFPLDKNQVAEFFDQTFGDDPKVKMWAAETAGSLVATATTTIDWNQGVVLLGLIAVEPHSRGKGLAQPFLEDVISKTFSDERIERIELNVYSFNAGAIRTYERIGFIKEGVRRSLARMGKERWDALHYSLLRDEYEQIRKK